MFTGMALRMAQEIGLHREQTPTNLVAADETSTRRSSEANLGLVGIEEFEKSAQVVLFWCVYGMEVNLCNGTGRVPSIKRHEISVRPPQDRDIAVIRAGPNGFLKPLKPEVYPHYATMMLSYAESIEFLNTSSSQAQGGARLDEMHRKDRLAELKDNLRKKYQSLPREIKFGALYYQAAVKAGQASPYLLIHLQYHLQIAFLTQESMAGEEASFGSLEGTVDEDGRLNLPEDDQQRDFDMRKTNEELYRSSIRSITDMLMFAKRINDSALLSTFWMNQPFFYAACAYLRDMLLQGGDVRAVADRKATGFPIPHPSAPSLVDPFQDYSHYPKRLTPPNSTRPAAESTRTYLTQIAKANYEFLREAIRVVAQFYSSTGAVGAILDQWEIGLREVDLNIVSNNTSSYIRPHDLRSCVTSDSKVSNTSHPPCENKF